MSADTRVNHGFSSLSAFYFSGISSCYKHLEEIGLKNRFPDTRSNEYSTSDISHPSAYYIYHVLCICISLNFP